MASKLFESLKPLPLGSPHAALGKPCWSAHPARLDVIAPLHGDQRRAPVRRVRWQSALVDAVRGDLGLACSVIITPHFLLPVRFSHRCARMAA